jgi:uncharacterized protein (TIGR03086 family)
MSEIADRYRRLAADFTDEVAAVPASDPRWAGPSPCPDWDAAGIVSHMVDTHTMFFGFIDRPMPAGPAVADDPLGAWTHVRDEMQAALDDPSVASQEFDGFAGRTRWETAVDRFISGDVLVHRWDLGRALGGNPQLDPDEVRRVAAGFEGIPEEMLRSGGAFGPAVEPPADADEQERFLAYLGRQPRSEDLH